MEYSKFSQTRLSGYLPNSYKFSHQDQRALRHKNNVGDGSKPSQIDNGLVFGQVANLPLHKKPEMFGLEAANK